MKLIAVTLALAAAQPLVPLSVQSVVKKKAGNLAYVPTRAPLRYEYRSYTWQPAPRALVIRLADTRFPPNGRHSVAFTVQPFRGDCTRGNVKSYQLDGNKVYSDGVVAWRCLNGVKLQAAGPNLPTVALGQIVASGRRIR